MVRRPNQVLPIAFQRGMTLLELIVVVAIIAVLSAIAFPAYSNYIEKARVVRAIAEIRGLAVNAIAFYNDNMRFPQNLGELNLVSFLDPWGNPYQFINIADAGDKVKCRKDRNLHPINSDYDLYSMGRDGKSSLPLTAQESQDDVIRANDGRYLGLASGY